MTLGKLKLTITGITFSIIALLVPGKTWAVSATPSAKPSDETIRQDIKDRVEKIKQTSDPEVKGMITALKSQKFGLVGTLEKIVGSTLQVRVFPQGTQKVIELDTDATLLKNQKPIPRADLELNSTVIVMGYLNSDQSYTGRRLIITDDELVAPEKATLYGHFQKSTNKILTLLSRQNNQVSPLDIRISTKTQYFNTIGTTIKRTDLRLNDPLVSVFADTHTATASATKIYTLSTRPTATP